MTIAHQLETAVRMARAGESHAAIVRATGLRAEQVEKVKAGSNAKGAEMHGAAQQIDIEDAIASHPLTVAEFAEKNGHPAWRVRQAIADGLLEVNRKVRPMTVQGGEMPLTAKEWQQAIAPATRRIKSSVANWANGDREFHLLGTDGRVRVFKIALTKLIAEQQRREIDAVPCRRVD